MNRPNSSQSCSTKIANNIYEHSVRTKDQRRIIDNKLMNRSKINVDISENLQGSSEEDVSHSPCARHKTKK